MKNWAEHNLEHILQHNRGEDRDHQSSVSTMAQTVLDDISANKYY